MPVESDNIRAVTGPKVNRSVSQTLASGSQVVDSALSHINSLPLHVSSLQVSIVRSFEDNIESLVGVDVKENERNSEEVEISFVSSLWNVVVSVINSLDGFSPVVGKLSVVVSSID